MKAKDYKKKLADMSIDELLKEEDALKAQLLKLRFQQATAYVDNPLEIRLVKRDIARVKTAITAKGGKA